MIKISDITYQDVRAYLESLGSFDTEDTDKILSPHPYSFFIELTENEFWNCIFLTSPSTRNITPENQSRSIRNVAARALRLIGTPNAQLGPNWDIDEIWQKSMRFVNENRGAIIQPLVLRDLQPNEKEISAFKYIHDGCHRSLGWAMLLLQGAISYLPLHAYLVTRDNLF